MSQSLIDVTLLTAFTLIFINDISGKMLYNSVFVFARMKTILRFHRLQLFLNPMADFTASGQDTVQKLCLEHMALSNILAEILS